MSASLIADSAARLFSQQVDRAVLDAFDRGELSAALWTRMEESGFPLALVPEASGGIGLTWADAFPIFWSLGRWQVPLPLAETMIANQLLAGAGQELQPGRIALAGGTNEINVTSGDRIHGRLRNVAWARHCQRVLVPNCDGNGRLGVVALQADGVGLELHVDQAAEPVDTVLLDNAPVTLLESPRTGTGSGSGSGSMPDALRGLGALAYCAMLCGALDACLHHAIVYANDRVQFGNRIGSYQAIQQQLARAAGEITAARTATLVAFRAAIESPTLPFDIAVAKVKAGEAASLAANVCHEVHGAIGFTREHILHFGTRRLWSWRARHGSDAYWAGLLGELAIRSGSDGFWQDFTARFANPPRRDRRDRPDV